MLNSQKGFTLIELIMVIVILGVLAVVAVPKYQDLSTEAKVAAANGVYAAAEGAAAINFATRLVSPSMATPITTGALLIAAMDGTPKGWAPSGATISDSTSTYHIGITTGEGPGNKAKLAKSGF